MNKKNLMDSFLKIGGMGVLMAGTVCINYYLDIPGYLTQEMKELITIVEHVILMIGLYVFFLRDIIRGGNNMKLNIKVAIICIVVWFLTVFVETYMIHQNIHHESVSGVLMMIRIVLSIVAAYFIIVKGREDKSE